MTLPDSKALADAVERVRRYANDRTDYIARDDLDPILSAAALLNTPEVRTLLQATPTYVHKRRSSNWEPGCNEGKLARNAVLGAALAVGRLLSEDQPK